MQFVGRFRGTDRVGHISHRINGDAACACTTDSKRSQDDRKWDALGRFLRDMKAIEDEEPTSSGLPSDEVAEKKRREDEEAAERDRQARQDAETAKRESEVSHQPPEHPHIGGEAYGITQNLGDAMKRFLAGVDAKYNRRKAPTSGGK